MTQATPVTGPRVWAGAALVSLTVLAGAWGLGELVAPGPWWPVTALAVLAAAGATAVMRTRMRSRVAPTAWAAIGALLGLVAVYGGPGTSPSLPVPTVETVRRLGRLAESGVAGIADGQIPVEPTRGLELVIVVGVLAVLLLVDLTALGLGRAGVAGLCLAGLWGAVALFDRPPALWVLVVAGASYLLLLTLTRPVPALAGGAWWRDLGPGAVVAAAVTLFAVVLGPVASALPLYGAVAVPSGWGSSGVDGPLRLSTDLDMRANLDPRSDRPLLRYTTSNGVGVPLRLYTVTSFDGREWRRSSGSAAEAVDADGILWPAAHPAPVWSEPLDEITVRIGDLDQDRLPITVEPRRVEVAGPWRYDPVLDEVLADGSTSRDTSYRLEVAGRDLTPEALRADRVAQRIGGDGPESEPTLALPESAFLPQIAALAEELTLDATTDFDRAMALQTWFRSAANFRYDADVPPARTADAVWDFLTDRTGYCVQYATAMAVMARSLGMPTRMAVGFLPGQVNPDVRGEYVVTGRQAHAWPEIWFEGAGWVRFEPTPAIQTGAPPTYADPNLQAPVAPPQEVPTASASPPASAPPRTEPAPGGGGMTIGDTTVPPLAVVGGVGFTLLLGGAVTALVLRRRRRDRSPVLSRPELAWGHLRDELARRGVTWPDSATPRQVGTLLTGQIPDTAEPTRRGPDEAPPARPDGVSEPDAERVNEAARMSLERLVVAVERERYTPPRDDPEPWPVHDLETWVAEAVLPFGEPPAEHATRLTGRRR